MKLRSLVSMAVVACGCSCSFGPTPEEWEEWTKSRGYSIEVRIVEPVWFSGPVGGPFVSDDAELRMRNTGSGALNYVTRSTATWLKTTAAGASGTLIAGGSVAWVVEIDEAAVLVSTGRVVAHLEILNAITFVLVKRLEVRLTIVD